ncbi:hypothetical protein Gpo141_00010877 [Globisporangium polare]
MLSPMKTAQLACFAAILTVTNVDAHGYMSAPAATFTTSGDPTQFCATMDGPSTLTAPSGMSFTSDPASNTKAFTAAMKAQTTYASMRALVDAKATFISGMDKQCGVTSPTGAKQPLPDKYVEWSHSSTEGFTPSHQGPCEVWCDDKMAFQDDNCAADYTTAPAKLPYDKTKCTGASMLKFYWLALHSSTWQVYLNCAPLVSSSSTTTTTTTTTTSPTVTPTTTTATPSATTKTPSATTKTPSATTKTPTTKATTKTPKPTKAAKTPKPTKKKESRSADYGFEDLN